MLYATEETKRTLHMECEEARFALKPWPIETTVVRQLDKNVCTCEEGLTSDAKAEEIAAEIGKTLLHSQQLREKLAANLVKERQNARKPDIREIYAPTHRKSQPLKESNSNSNSNSNLNLNVKSSNQKENNLKNVRPRRSASLQRPAEPRKLNSNNRMRSASTVRSRESNENQPVSGRKRAPTSKLQIQTSKDNELAKITGYHKKKPETNFILANKMSLKSARSTATSNTKLLPPKSQIKSRKIVEFNPKPAVTASDKGTSMSGKDMRNEEIETLNDLERLIKKFSAEITVNSSKLRSSCPIHAENASGVIEEKVVTYVDAVEGLDRFGVPPQLIKILKTYHSYVKAEVFNEATTTNNNKKKQQEAANDFMNSFERISNKRKASDLSKYQDLLEEYSGLYSQSYKHDLNHHDLKVLKAKYVSLESMYNDCNVKETGGNLKFFKTICNEIDDEFAFDKNNWMSNGVWNYSSILDLNGVFGSHCTRYSDRNQLLLFYDLIQKVQRKTYETELIEVLIRTIISKLKDLDPNCEEYIKIYKMTTTIAQILNPRVPVLATAENDD